MKSCKSSGDSTLPSEGARAAARDAMRALQDAQLPFLVAGAYAFACYTDIERHTKDFDIFVEERDIDRALRVLEKAGFCTEMESEIWLAKARRAGELIDLVFNSGNGLSPVDESWFDHAVDGEVFGMKAEIAGAEELLWTKAYIMERDRYDGADVAHLLHCCAEELDWPRLLERFGDHWRLLLSHMLLFQFIYPSQRNRLPGDVLDALLSRADAEINRPSPDAEVCRGTLLSRGQYFHDLDHWGYIDGRAVPHGELSQDQADDLSRPYRP